MDDEVTGVSYVKGTGVIDFPKNVVETFLQEEKYKTSYDKVYKEGRAIEQINANAIYEHFEVNMPIFISNRDFCILKGVFERKNGKRVAVAYSVVHPKCPEVKIKIKFNRFFYEAVYHNLAICIDYEYICTFYLKFILIFINHIYLEEGCC